MGTEAGVGPDLVDLAQHVRLEIYRGLHLHNSGFWRRHSGGLWRWFSGGLLAMAPRWVRQ